MKHGYGSHGSSASFKGQARDGKQKAGLESGTSHKGKITESDAALGLHSVGKNEKSGANPSVKVGRGHTIK